jgi:transposase
VAAVVRANGDIDGTAAWVRDRDGVRRGWGRVPDRPQDIVPPAQVTAVRRSARAGHRRTSFRLKPPWCLLLVRSSEEVEVSDEDLRKEAVGRRRGGESAEEIAAALGRTDRWVRKWVARAEEEASAEGWATSRSRAPHRSPTRTPEELRRLIVDARMRLVANPRAKYGPLAVARELRRVGVEPIPNRWTIEREIARAGLAKPRRRPPGYLPKGVPFPDRATSEPGEVHQIDMVGPRHLDGGVAFRALNLLDVGSHGPRARSCCSRSRTWWLPG